MLCTNCNALISEGSSFCPRCGKPVVTGNGGQRKEAPMEPTSMDLPPRLNKAIVLRPKERMTGIWSASRQRKVQTSEGERDASDPGYLVASSHRLFFIKESGLFNKSYSAIETIALEDLTGVTTKRGLLSSALIISHERGETKIVNLYSVDPAGDPHGKAVAPELVQHLLNNAARGRLEDLEREKQMSRVQYVLDFSFLRSEMEKGGIVVQTIKCPACGAGMALPPSGNNARCPYCGSMVQAQDIFEKMKGLIGAL